MVALDGGFQVRQFGPGSGAHDGYSGHANRWKGQSGEDRDHRDDDQEFDEREGGGRVAYCVLRVV
jgi:hypothetical protein